MNRKAPRALWTGTPGCRRCIASRHLARAHAPRLPAHDPHRRNAMMSAKNGRNEPADSGRKPVTRERRTQRGNELREKKAEKRNGGNSEEEKRKVTSPTLGTGGKRLWLLRSRPDQVDRPSMRGGPSRSILTSVAPHCECRIAKVINQALTRWIEAHAGHMRACARRSCKRLQHRHIRVIESMQLRVVRSPTADKRRETLLPICVLSPSAAHRDLGYTGVDCCRSSLGDRVQGRLARSWRPRIYFEFWCIVASNSISLDPKEVFIQ